MISALKNGFLSGLNFSGRMSRKEFWAFAPIWAALCTALLVGLRLLFPSNAMGIPVLIVAALFSIPVWSAVWRRFQDVGISGIYGIYPLAPIACALSCLFVIFMSEGPLTLGSKDPVAIVLVICACAVFPAFFFRLFASQSIGERIGELLVSSYPNANKYGPNPLEVSQ